MRTSHSPLGHSAFRWLLAGRTVDALGNAIAPVALGFAVLDLFGSLTVLGVVVGGRSLGNVLLLLLGGVVADRLPRSVVLIASNVVAGVAQAGVAVLVIAGYASVPGLLGLAFVSGAAAAFDFPATAALVPETVPRPSLHRANALLRLSLNGSLIGGASLAGVLVASIGPGLTLGVDAVTFFIAPSCYARIQVQSRIRPERGTSLLDDFSDGWREFRARTWVWVVVLAFFAINAAWVGGFNVLGLAVADDTIGRSGWGFVVGSVGVGMLAGALVAGQWDPDRPLVVGMAVTTLLAPPLLVLALHPTLPALLAVAAIAGVGVSQFGVAWETALQRHIPGDRLARVASFDALGSFAAIPAGEVIVGPAADRVGTDPVLLAAAGVIVAAALVALAVPDVRRLDRWAGTG